MRFKWFYVLLFVLFICSCSKWETSENFYKTYNDAVAQDALKRGWIPEIIPESAINIYEKHDIDTNALILTFKYKDGLNSVLVDTCQQLNVSEVKWPKIKAQWWPSDLTEMSKFSTPRFIFYYCSQYSGYFAINTNDREAYFWILHE